MSATPTELTLRQLRADGWPLVQVVEVWNPHARIRQDLFGLVDVLAVGPQGTLAVQTTSRANVSARVRKIADSPTIAAIREAGWTVLVHGWHQPKGPGTRWVLGRVVDVS